MMNNPEQEFQEANFSSAVKEQSPYRDVIVRNRDKKRVLSLDEITHLKAFAGGCYFYTYDYDIFIYVGMIIVGFILTMLSIPINIVTTNLLYNMILGACCLILITILSYWVKCFKS